LISLANRHERQRLLVGLANTQRVFMQKRYQILADYATHGSFAVSARENRVSYNTARAICEKFIATGDCQAGVRGRPVRKLQPFMAAYLEAMIFVNPFLY